VLLPFLPLLRLSFIYCTTVVPNVDSLLDRVKQSTPVWRDQGVQFIHSISKLLELLLDYRSVMDGDENRDKRMSCTVNLLRFYKDDINRSEMYIRYIYKLCDLHIPAENYTEAGFTLKLHADSLTWSRTLLPASAGLPCSASDPPAPLETECQLKERLYLNIIDYFDKGKCWEEGIPLIKELATFYEKSCYDYAKLSSILVSLDLSLSYDPVPAPPAVAPCFFLPFDVIPMTGSSCHSLIYIYFLLSFFPVLFFLPSSTFISLLTPGSLMHDDRIFDS
jgi:hypothetical protein